MDVARFVRGPGRPAARLVGVAALAAVLGAGVHARFRQAPAATSPAGAPAGAPDQSADQGAVRGPHDEVIGFTKLAEIPGTPWRIHDVARPHPRVVTAGATPGAPPSDAIVLFDGTSLGQWYQMQQDRQIAPKWIVRDGYFEVAPRTGSLYTRDRFGDVQLHLEFMTPSPARGYSQDRGNSGIKFMDFYEVQVLDSYQSLTYADGQAGAIYGEYPPLVNVARQPGEWQTYDIMFEAPRFEGDRLVSPAYVTVIWNGVLVQHRRQIMGRTSATTTVHAYTPHAAELPLTLQDHNHPVRYRNVWIRRLAGYDQPEAK
jgi:3-keto-disaccharide hydrolase